jgi:hypothetical protein
MLKRRHGWTLCLLIAVAVIIASPVRGDDKPTPGAKSTSSAILGAEGWYAGALPPPGLHLLDYTLYYTAHEFRGERGGDVESPPFSDFDARVIAQVIRPIYVSDKKLFGANLAWHAVIPVVAKRQSSDFFDDSMEGLGDIYVSPFILTWHKPPFHYAAGLDVITPTGSYSSHDLTTIGNNHWTFEPAFAFSYLAKSGLCASTKLMYDYHTEDHKLDYQEGQQFHLDYNVGYQFGPKKRWKAGICGYWLTSLEEDEWKRDRLSGSEEQVFSAGPTLAYGKDNWLVALKAQKEFEAENRPEGTAYWLKIVYSF